MCGTERGLMTCAGSRRWLRNSWPSTKLQGEYAQILKKYQGATSLAMDMVPRMRDAQFDLERSLQEYAYHKGEDTRRAFLDIPPYIRHVIIESQSQYTELPGNYYVLARRL